MTAGKQAQVVFITGASSGIGRAAALACAEAGYHVAGTARRAERLDSLRDEIAALPGEHGDFLALPGDVTAEDSMREAVSRTVAHFGRLDVLVANAGVGHRGAVAEADWDDLQTLLRTNIDGVLHSIRACVPAMRGSGGGHVITISSVSYNLVAPNAAIYSASKAFVSSLARSLRLELQRDNIRISDFILGRTDTEFNERRLGAGARKRSSVPSMSAEQVAEAIVRTIQRPRNTVILRWIDRLIVLGNRLVPGLIGLFVKREYK